MSLRRRLVAAGGLVAVGLGFAGIVGGVTGPLSLTELFITLVGAIAVAQGARYAFARRGTPVRSTPLGTPERRYRAVVPGDDFDATIRVRTPTPQRLKRVRRRIRAAAIDSLVAQGVPRAAARTAVDEGAWTDDSVVVDFLEAGATPLPTVERVRAFVRRETAFKLRVRRSVDAVDALWADDGSWPDLGSASDGGTEGSP